MTGTMALAGLMQHHALTVDRFIDFAARWHGATPVISRTTTGETERSSYSEIAERARLLSSALLGRGIGQGDRVATLAMNHARHVEAWYGVMGIGAVCHTVNPRLFDEQITYIINHAADRILLADAAFIPLLARVLPHCPSIEQVVLFPDGSVEQAPFPTIGYEDLLREASSPASWSGIDEQAACGLCYTSGTTGSPKGVLYSHRSNYLHALATLQHDFMNFSARDVVLPVVPMFHANAWGIAFSAPASGAKLVMPGARLDGASLESLIHEEGVTFAAGVPTVWQGLLQHIARSGGSLGTLKRVLIGGSACPPALLQALEDDHGVEVVHAWGMTETSPVATAASPTVATGALPPEQRRAQSLKQGRPMFDVDLCLKGEDGEIVPHDGATPGHLMVRGSTVAGAYFRHDANILDADGWFDTGDVATIDGHGFVRITDRSKDLIKSGGEWISSIEIENMVMSHPAVANAAVVGQPHERWGERPLLIVEPREGARATPGELIAHLEGRIAKWWMPDEVRFVDRIPLGATGKIDKKRIRAEMIGQPA
ncbi:MAG: long-chain fatty acid--CoA ligase [Pseudomonadota bacterium]|uniref:long-chain fatty acid--CoA ligase n=1 Tax=Rhizorhabdus phycosphaerae TaxID=2711156 RepID=UPI001D00EF69|nr:long-chain fatty acid--CoA ligase [Rhizorhabdus phycosphaerae]